MIEEQPVNTILATMHATDADSTISEYQLIDANEDDNGSEFFEINNVTGKFKLRGMCKGGRKKNIKFMLAKPQKIDVFYCIYTLKTKGMSFSRKFLQIFKNA